MQSNRRYFSILTAAALAAVLSACSGGGSSPSSLPATTNNGGSPSQPSSNQGNATANMVVTIPAKTSASNRRNPKFISASTQSMTVSLVANGKTTLLTTANLTPSSPGCSVGSGGATQCTVSFLTSAGSDTFQMNMYDQANGKGNLLSTGQTPVENIVAGQANTVDVTLDGVPASLSVVLGQGTLPVGTASSTSLTVVAEDADNNVIVGPGGFSSAIALAITGDTYSTLSVSYGQGQTSITSPGQTVTLNYNGATNVGSIITASTTGASSGSATFAGSGAAMTVIPSNFVVNGSEFYFYPTNVAAYPDGSGAAFLGGYYYTGYFIATVSTSGTWQLFTGSGSSYAGESGITTVAGMSTTFETSGYEDSYDMLAADSNKNIYYSAENSASCYVIGKLNPTAATTTETVLQGEAMYPHVDSNGNVWFLEKSSTCSSSSGSGFASGWGIGELSSTGTLTERDLGISGLEAADMGITPDGSTMIVADYGALLYKLPTSSLTASTLTLSSNVEDPYALAVDPSGNAVWSTDEWHDDDVYYGSTTSSFASATATLFPIPYFGDSYGATYADGSFWMSCDYDYCGVGRVSGVASGTPTASYYQLPGSDDEIPELYDVSAAGGIVWGADDYYGNAVLVQYGAPSTTGATVTFNKVRTLGAAREPKNAHALVHQRHSV
jgi:hypothetical protein